MRFKTTRDVLDRIVLFHKNLSEFYQRLSSVNEMARVKLLLDYMSRHEEQLRKNLAHYEDGVSAKILDTWFKYDPSSTILKNCDENPLKPYMSVEEVMDMALKFDDCLLNFYTKMAENCCIEDLKEIFSNLQRMGKRAKQNFVRNAQEIYDL